jgi:four helix bundle protein
MSERIDSYRDLKVYKLAFELQQEIYLISKTFPIEERYSLTDQIRRSSHSIGANIAEAWQKRRYVAHFISKLTDSDGENAETEHWIESAHACSYLSDNDRDSLLAKCIQIGKMLGSMISKPENFCKHSQ